MSAEGRHFDKAIAADVLTELVDAGCGGWSVRAANGRADRICHEMDGLGRVSIGLSLFSLTEWGQE